MNFKLEINKDKLNRDDKNGSFLCKQAVATAASCMISITTGFTLGISAVMLPQLRDDKSIQHDPGLESWIASIATLSMIIGSLSSGPILDSFGRKPAHIILGIPFIVGWIVLAFAKSPCLLLIGRFITGISAGANKPVTMVYIGEILDPKNRAIGLFLPGFLTPAGVLISHLIGYYLGWRISSMIFVLPSIVSLVIFMFLKESPLWLIAKGKLTEGVETFRWFRGTKESSEIELQTVLDRQHEKPTMSIKETLKVACSMAFIKPMLILIVIMINIQIAGINALSFYSQDIFDQAFSGRIDPFIMTITMDCIRNLVCLGMCVIGNLVPRKLSLLVSSYLVTLFNFGLVACFAVGFNNILWVPVFCLVMFIIFSSVVMSTGWTFVPELLPTNARGFGFGLNSACSFLSLFISVQIIPGIMSSFGEVGLFVYFGTASLICGDILSFTLPETNGKTLQSIEDSYSKNIVSQNSHCSGRKEFSSL